MNDKKSERDEGETIWPTAARKTEGVDLEDFQDGRQEREMKKKWMTTEIGTTHSHDYLRAREQVCYVQHNVLHVVAGVCQNIARLVSVCYL